MSETSVNKKIKYIIDKERMPLAITDYLYLFVLALIILGALGIINEITDWNSLILIASSFLAMGLFYLIYTAYQRSFQFKKLTTHFSQTENCELIQYSLRQLNIRSFQQVNHPNLFVYFIHKPFHQREEIYLLAKDNDILLHSNNDKEANDGAIDYVDQIGSLLYKNMIRIHQLRSKKF